MCLKILYFKLFEDSICKRPTHKNILFKKTNQWKVNVKHVLCDYGRSTWYFTETSSNEYVTPIMITNIIEVATFIKTTPKIFVGVENTHKESHNSSNTLSLRIFGSYVQKTLVAWVIWVTKVLDKDSLLRSLVSWIKHDVTLSTYFLKIHLPRQFASSLYPWSCNLQLRGITTMCIINAKTWTSSFQSSKAVL